MVYRLRRGEGAGEALGRLVAEQVRLAVAAIDAPRLAREEAVHAVRKHCKKVRAVLDLGRTVLGVHYAPERAHYRALGRGLAARRDAWVVAQTCTRLAGRRARGEVGSERLTAVAKCLRSRALEAEQPGQGPETELDAARAALLAGAVRIAEWPAPPGGFDLLEAGYARAYRRARRNMARAYRSGEEARFHAWRKEAKNHWYHQRLLVPLWPRVFGALALELRALGELLGEEHDLTVLRATLAGEPDAFGDPQAVSALLRAAQHRRLRVRERARARGARLFCDPVAVQVRRVRRCWGCWAGER